MSTAFDGTERISHLSTLGVLVAKLAGRVEICPAWKMTFLLGFFHSPDRFGWIKILLET